MRFPPSIARQGYGEECQELSLRGWKSLLLSAYICVCMRVCMCVCPSLCLRVLFVLECTCLSPGDYDSLPSLRSLSSYHTLYAQSNDMYNFTNRPAVITRSSCQASSSRFDSTREIIVKLMWQESGLTQATLSLGWRRLVGCRCVSSLLLQVHSSWELKGYDARISNKTDGPGFVYPVVRVVCF